MTRVVGRFAVSAGRIAPGDPMMGAVRRQETGMGQTLTEEVGSLEGLQE